MAVDEQTLPLRFASLNGAARKRQGAYFTPTDIVELTLDLVAPWVPRRSLHVVDPACGAGAFLEAAVSRWPSARFAGLELSEDVARYCAERVPQAQVLCADALRGGLDQLNSGGGLLFVGNPPYNGTSPLLTDKPQYERLCALLPEPLPSGTSLRDDFAFFLLSAASALRSQPGAMAFITPSTLLDAFMYSPLRSALTKWLSLVEVVDLGPGIFEGAKVRTCITVWTNAAKKQTGRYRRLSQRSPLTFVDERQVAAKAPEFLLRPAVEDAAALDACWRGDGEELLSVIPVSLPGLKTRFDELLVDDDPEVLFERVRRFLSAHSLDAFAVEHGLSPHLAKLEALKTFVGSGVAPDRRNVRRFFRYKGVKHRGSIPASAQAWCYLDRRLIPRGDHRFRGQYDPHACEFKLVFNTRELPLASAITETAGCVHAYRHTRFAPLYVPKRVRDEGLDSTRSGGDLGPLVPNLSARASTLGAPEEVFRALCAFINSDDVQQRWAPAFAASRDLIVPISAIEAQLTKPARRAAHT